MFLQFLEKSIALPHDVLQCIQTQSKEPKEIVVQFQECLQLTPAELENPEPGTQRWIRRLANEAKSQNRIDVVEYLRTITPAGTTGTSTTKTPSLFYYHEERYFQVVSEVFPASFRKEIDRTLLFSTIATSFSPPLDPQKNLCWNFVDVEVYTQICMYSYGSLFYSHYVVW